MSPNSLILHIGSDWIEDIIRTIRDSEVEPNIHKDRHLTGSEATSPQESIWTEESS